MSRPTGKFDCPITIITSSVVVDDMGGRTPTWTTHASLWAMRVPLRASERFEARQVVNTKVTTYRTRYLSTVTPEMRLVDGATIYHIRGIQVEGRNETLLIDCEEVRGE